MTEISNIILENEMDLPLTHKRAGVISRFLGLTISTQATFATAVSELCRAVIEKSLNNVLSFNLSLVDQRWFLSAVVITDSVFTEHSEELKYAKRLIPIMELERKSARTMITLKLGLPKSLLLDPARIIRLKENILSTLPLSPYEEIKQKNKELFSLAEEREEQLRLSNYLNEKKSEFLSIASHELKTPLTIIKSYAQIGKSLKDKNPEKMAEYLDKIDLQATKVNQLIQQMLDLTKIENNQIDYRLEQVELTDFISDIVTSVRSLYPEHYIAVEFSSKVEVVIDKLRIEQVLINLLSNAAKYSQPNTVITIKTNLIPNEKIIISVIDQGIGLSKENLDKVFDKFFRAEEVVQKISGLGMGLFITARIIKEHKGELWADSVENTGSTFSFSLPHRLTS